jgi:hypothetical protein
MLCGTKQVIIIIMMMFIGCTYWLDPNNCSSSNDCPNGFCHQGVCQNFDHMISIKD